MKAGISLAVVALVCCFASIAQAQTPTSGKVVDRIIAVIGDEIVLESDVDNQVNYLKINGQKDNGSLRCDVMENLIVSKLLLNKAQQDSLVVGEDQVQGEIERRMGVFMDKIDRTEFEKIYGKTVEQFREDISPEIRDELLIDQQRKAMMSEATITPKEVKKFFESINKDSLGILPAEVEINHIVITPPYSKASEEKVKKNLTDLRKRIVEDKVDFGEMASKNTDEPGGRQRKGDLGWFGRGMMVSEFEEIVFQMRPGDVSEPFRTEFGYHIVKLLERKGEQVHAAHILKKVEFDTKGDSIAIDSLNRILKLIELDSLTFEEAAITYSSDRQSKHCGGCISNPQTGELRLPLDALDPDMYFKIDAMKAGEISKPTELLQADGSRAFHLLYLKAKVPPHVPNLRDDYQKIYTAALQARQAEEFEEWLQSAKKNIYIDIKPTECSNALKFWVE
ncbi:MAG: hypothetical protein EAZ89_19020 [Bacteroidetes bacterium]|nr:MAG: hypothetical protein EAZ89_19020 [Bacteroidota bacterium]